MFKYLFLIVVSINTVLSARAFSDKDSSQAKDYLSHAKEYFARKNFDSSLICIKRAENIYLKLGDWEQYISSRKDFSEILDASGRTDSAIAYAAESLSLTESRLGQKHLLYSALRQSIGRYYIKQANYKLALDYFLQTLEIVSILHGEKCSFAASCFNDIGRVYYYLGNYEKALEFFLKHYRLSSELYGDDNREIASVLNNLGVISYAMGDFNRAMEFYQKALGIRIKIFGENSKDVAATLNNMGAIYYATTEYEKAIEYYLRSLEIKKHLLPAKDPEIASSLNNLGTVYDAKGDAATAIEYYQKALSLRLEIFGEKHPDVASSLNNIGVWYNLQKQYEPALENFLKAYEIRKTLFGENHPDVASTLNNIASMYLFRQDTLKAIECFEKELNIKTGLYGNRHPEVALSLKELGELYYLRGKYDTALTLLQKSLCANSRTLTTRDINSFPPVEDYLQFETYFQAIKLKGDCFHKLALEKDNFRDPAILLARSLNYYLLADSLINKKRRTVTLRNDKIYLGRLASEIYEKAAGITLELYRLSGNRKYTEEAFYFSEKNKFSVLLESLSEQDGLKYGGIPDSLLFIEHFLKTELNNITNKISEAQDSTEEAELRDKLFTLNRKYEELLFGFEKSYGQYYNLKYNEKSLSITDIRKSLDGNTAVISYFTGDSTIFRFIISKERFDVSAIVKPRNLEDTIKYYRESILTLDGSLKSIYKTAGGYLSKLLIPESLLKDHGIKNLILIPDNYLTIIPFEILPVEENFVKNHSMNTRYLISRFNISYSYSANLLFRKNRGSMGSVSKKLLALAPVNFYGANKQSTKPLDQDNGSGNDTLSYSASAGRLYVIKREEFVPPLPETEREVKDIETLFKSYGYSPDILLSSRASENFIRNNDLENYGVVHFATHAKIYPGSPEQSNILLSFDTTGQTDGRLTTGEVYSLRLNADLLVLSACETALGEISKGEGLIGLTRAFLFAGAKNQLVSLWPVNDNSTAEFMIEFYKNCLKGSSYSEALRRAKLKMISSKKYSAPFYWSPFILIANN